MGADGTYTSLAFRIGETNADCWLAVWFVPSGCTLLRGENILRALKKAACEFMVVIDGSSKKCAPSTGHCIVTHEQPFAGICRDFSIILCDSVPKGRIVGVEEVLTIDKGIAEKLGALKEVQGKIHDKSLVPKDGVVFGVNR